MQKDRQRRRAVCFALGILTLLMLTEGGWAQQKAQWRIKNRLQLGYEFDDNIREASSESIEPIEDSSLRFLFHSRAVRTAARSSIVFSYRGGLQAYFDNDFENKLINEITVSTGIRARKFVLGVRGFGRLKNYLNDVLDYATGSVEPYVQLPKIGNWRNEVAAAIGGINYQNFSSFDYTDAGLKWIVSRKLARRLSVSFEVTGRRISYDRPAIEIPNDTTTVFLDTSQEDHNYGMKFQVNFTKSYLISLSYAFRRNQSNSAGYGFYKHQLVVIFGFPLSDGIWLRGYGAAQLKSYTEDLNLVVPIDLDSERDESNFFTLDLSKDMSESLTVLFRFASYDNESVIRNVFYRKNTFTVGFDYRF